MHQNHWHNKCHWISAFFCRINNSFSDRFATDYFYFCFCFPFNWITLLTLFVLYNSPISVSFPRVSLLMFKIAPFFLPVCKQWLWLRIFMLRSASFSPPISPEICIRCVSFCSSVLTQLRQNEHGWMHEKFIEILIYYFNHNYLTTGTFFHSHHENFVCEIRDTVYGSGNLLLGFYLFLNENGIWKENIHNWILIINKHTIFISNSYNDVSIVLIGSYSIFMFSHWRNHRRLYFECVCERHLTRNKWPTSVHLWLDKKWNERVATHSTSLPLLLVKPIPDKCTVWTMCKLRRKANSPNQRFNRNNWTNRKTAEGVWDEGESSITVTNSGVEMSTAAAMETWRWKYEMLKLSHNCPGSRRKFRGKM